MFPQVIPIDISRYVQMPIWTWMAGSVRSYSSSFGQAGHQSFLQLNPLLGAPIRVIHRIKLVMTTLFDPMSFGGATPRQDR